MTTRSPPSRPWSRLASIRPSIAPTPAPTIESLPPPQTRRLLPRPAFQPTVQPQPLFPPSGAGVAAISASPAVRPAGGVASLPTSTVRGPASAVASAPAVPPPIYSHSIKFPTSPVPVASVLPPATTPASVRSSTTPRAVATTSSLPNSTATKAVITPTPRVPTPTTIMPAVQTPLQAPNPKPSLTVPRFLVKSNIAESEHKFPLVAEPKTELVQKMFDKPKAQRDVADSLSSSSAYPAKQELPKYFKTNEKSNRKKVFSDSEDSISRVITITGE